MEKGLILNTLYNDFILGTHVSDYFDKRHEEGVASDSPYNDIVSFEFYDDGVELWCKNTTVRNIYAIMQNCQKAIVAACLCLLYRSCRFCRTVPSMVSALKVQDLWLGRRCKVPAQYYRPCGQ